MIAVLDWRPFNFGILFPLGGAIRFGGTRSTSTQTR